MSVVKVCIALRDESLCIDDDDDGRWWMMTTTMIMMVMMMMLDVSYRCVKYIGHNPKEASLCLSLGSKKHTHFVLNYDVPFLQ